MFLDDKGQGWGSSPRMRGALRSPQGQGTRTRIIPADAGSTIHELVCSLVEGDHPRGCGEHSLNGV